MQHFVLCTRVTVAQLVELVGCYYSGGLVVGTLGSFSPAEMSLKQTLNTKLPCVIVYGKNVLWFASKLKKKKSAKQNHFNGKNMVTSSKTATVPVWPGL